MRCIAFYSIYVCQTNGAGGFQSSEVKVEHHIIFILPLPEVQIEKCVFLHCKLKIFNTALLVFSNLACVPTVSTVPLRCNTPKTLLQLSVKDVASKVLILIAV